MSIKYSLEERQLKPGEEKYLRRAKEEDQINMNTAVTELQVWIDITVHILYREYHEMSKK